MKYVSDVKQLIGNTPLFKISNVFKKKDVNIYAKLEFLNPGGSVKDRIGFSMVRDAEERGILKEGYTIVEATAGNTGIGIALATLNSGYRRIFVVPEKFSMKKLQFLKLLVQRLY